jgi:hypothetical protein
MPSFECDQQIAMDEHARPRVDINQQLFELSTFPLVTPKLLRCDCALAKGPQGALDCKSFREAREFFRR